jgi:ABC-type Fe3+ transport system substrate-binding protein
MLAALRRGAHLEAVPLPEQDSLRIEVSYAIGMLKDSKHRQASEVFLSFLRSSECQDAYTKFGFVNASETELQLKAIP